MRRDVGVGCSHLCLLLLQPGLYALHLCHRLNVACHRMIHGTLGDDLTFKKRLLPFEVFGSLGQNRFESQEFGLLLLQRCGLHGNIRLSKCKIGSSHLNSGFKGRSIYPGNDFTGLDFRIEVHQHF